MCPEQRQYCQDAFGEEWYSKNKSQQLKHIELDNITLEVMTKKKWIRSRDQGHIDSFQKNHNCIGKGRHSFSMEWKKCMDAVVVCLKVDKYGQGCTKYQHCVYHTMLSLLVIIYLGGNNDKTIRGI